MFYKSDSGTVYHNFPYCHRLDNVSSIESVEMYFFNFPEVDMCSSCGPESYLSLIDSSSPAIKEYREHYALVESNVITNRYISNESSG
jgi:hypothetical protein